MKNEINNREEKYIYKIFSTPKGNYIYDRNSGTLALVESEKDFWELKRYNRNIIKKYLEENKLEEVKHPLTNFFDKCKENYLSHLILQVTQNCNMN